MKKELLFVGLDVHAKSITIALAESGGDANGEARIYGTIPDDLHGLEKVFAKLKKALESANCGAVENSSPVHVPNFL